MTPILIALAVCLPIVGLMGGIYLWIQRSRIPELIRFKVLRVLLYVIIGSGSLVMFVEVLGSEPGESVFASLLLYVFLFFSFGLGAGSVALEMRKCRRNFREKLMRNGVTQTNNGDLDE
ncbi:MAG: hypothetical protein K9N52_01775 [Verrucomicrobia bacterium]|nr:hypothetical protein [Verrucomicrobiota bacterium]